LERTFKDDSNSVKINIQLDVVIAKGTKVGECTIEKTAIEVRRNCANQRCNTDFTAMRHMQG